jgi:hypothetical protein
VQGRVLVNRVCEAFTEHDGKLVGRQFPRALSIFQYFSILRKASNTSLVAASLLGKWPRFLTIFRRLGSTQHFRPVRKARRWCVGFKI